LQDNLTPKNLQKRLYQQATYGKTKKGKQRKIMFPLARGTRFWIYRKRYEMCKQNNRLTQSNLQLLPLRTDYSTKLDTYEKAAS
jgi:hypothetical protein